jgi:radical SAM protein with 4Fe4S-binding SPASM domain
MITNVDDINPQNLTDEMRQIADRLNLADAREALFFPKYFQLETVRVCNATCPFCAIDQWDKSVPVMKDWLFDKIVEEMSGYSDWIENVCIQRAGEPLLDKKIVRRVKHVKEAGIKSISMSTNISLLTESKSRELLEAGLNDIMLSIDSIDKSPYEEMRVGLSYETVMENIEVFFKVREEISPEMIVRVRGVSFHDLDDENHRNELKRWDAFWRQFSRPQDRIYMKQPHSWGNQKSWDGHIPEYDLTYHPCIMPWSTMHITTDGIVALCGQDYDAKINLGDLKKDSIADVWHSDAWTEIRAVHERGRRNEIDLCQGCRLWDLDFSLEDKKELTEAS